MQGPMLKALRRFTQLLRVHIYVPGCCKYIRMTNGLQPLVELCLRNVEDLLHERGVGALSDKTSLSRAGRFRSLVEGQNTPHSTT